MNFNLSIVGGNIVRDPDLSYTPNQTPVAKFTIATNDRIGENEHTSFIDCVAFGKRAELIVKYFTKGSRILISGRLQQDRWKTDEGYNRSKIKVIANDFKFVDRASDNDSPKDDYNDTNDDEDDVFRG